MQQPPGSQARCGSCGAPDDGELVYCRFCKNAISAQAVQSAIPCPQCRTACRWGKQKCVQCQAWLVVACVFCGAISPHCLPACLACREPFAGAVQKKQAQMQAAQQQQRMQAVGTYGNVAASFLGAMAGGAASHSWFGNSVPHHHHSWNESNSSWDNSSFDPGSYDTSSYDNSSSSYDNSGGGSDWSGSSGESDAASAGDAGSSFDSGGGGGDWGGGDGS